MTALSMLNSRMMMLHGGGEGCTGEAIATPASCPYSLATGVRLCSTATAAHSLLNSTSSCFEGSESKNENTVGCVGPTPAIFPVGNCFSTSLVARHTPKGKQGLNTEWMSQLL